MADRGRIKKISSGRRYLLAITFLPAAVGLLGLILNDWISNTPSTPLATDTGEDKSDSRLERIFAEAVQQMQQGRYQQALDLWHSALLINPDIPEIKVNMGFSLFEMGDYRRAREFFIDAMEQNAFQANAYYGLAICSEKMGDLEGALGAMRSYIHLASSESDQRFVRYARAAIWEWESQLEGDTAAPGSNASVPQSDG